MRPSRGRQEGMILTVVVIVLTMITLLGGFVLNLAYNQYRLSGELGIKRAVAQARARAGIVDAQWRIRTDPDGLFTANGPTYDPAAYTLDTDADGTDDVTVDITAVIDGGRTRRIVATGIDS